MVSPFCEFQVQGAPKLPSLEVEEAKPKAGRVDFCLHDFCVEFLLCFCCVSLFPPFVEAMSSLLGAYSDSEDEEEEQMKVGRLSTAAAAVVATAGANKARAEAGIKQWGDSQHHAENSQDPTFLKIGDCFFLCYELLFLLDICGFERSLICCCISRFWPQALKPQAPKAAQTKTSQELRPGGLLLELWQQLQVPQGPNMGFLVDQQISGFLWVSPISTVRNWEASSSCGHTTSSARGHWCGTSTGSTGTFSGIQGCGGATWWGANWGETGWPNGKP